MVNAWDTPWRIVGPVLLEDLIDPVRVPRGIEPNRDGESIYVEGDRVWLAGSIYEANWWNEGFQPNREVSNDWETPWTELDPSLFVEPSSDD